MIVRQGHSDLAMMETPVGACRPLELAATGAAKGCDLVFDDGLDGVDDGADELDGGVLVGMGGELALNGCAVGVAQLGVDVDLADATAGGGGVGVVGVPLPPWRLR